MTTRKSVPKEAVVVATYAEFEQFVEAFAAGHLNLLLVIGRAGVAKSQTIRRAVGNQVCWVESNATAFGIYRQIYEHRDRLVVIDDVDSLYSDKAAVRLLKCLCQTDPVKNVAWHTASTRKESEGEGLPIAFKTKSRVALIANDWKTLNANTAAVEDRGHLICFNPSSEEVHRKVAEWFWDQDIYDWFGEFLHLIPNLSMRHYVRASELKQSGLDWVKMLVSDAIPEKALLVAKLKADPSFKEERDRVAAFQAAGGGGKTTWYKWSRRIRSDLVLDRRLLSHQRAA